MIKYVTALYKRHAIMIMKNTSNLKKHPAIDMSIKRSAII